MGLSKEEAPGVGLSKEQAPGGAYSGPENFLVFRIIIVGSKGVGKSSIAR